MPDDQLNFNKIVYRNKIDRFFSFFFLSLTGCSGFSNKLFVSGCNINRSHPICLISTVQPYREPTSKRHWHPRALSNSSIFFGIIGHSKRRDGMRTMARYRNNLLEKSFCPFWLISTVRLNENNYLPGQIIAINAPARYESYISVHMLIIFFNHIQQSPRWGNRRNDGRQPSEYRHQKRRAAPFSPRARAPICTVRLGRTGASLRAPNAPHASVASRVVSEHDDLAQGVVSATVDMSRPGIVVLSASFDPGWKFS